MSKKKSSSRAWLKQYHSDPYVKLAQKEGLRSRASYKLLEINQRDQIIKPGMSVLDLGSSPGGWSQVAARLVGPRGRVIANDIQEMNSLCGVTFVRGDFTDTTTLDALSETLGIQPIDVVLSDMAPNLSGLPAVDQPRTMLLLELALDLASKVLVPGGAFVTKAFQGEGFEAWLRDIRTRFARVSIRKPTASRPKSREIYVVGYGAKSVTAGTGLHLKSD